MQLFISWSGQSSRLIGSTLKEFLPKVVPSVTTWMSEKDIPPGGLWGSALQHQLSEAEYAVICVTNENTVSPWLYYELGCLAMKVPVGFVVPLLHGIDPKDLPAPLNSFQAASANRDGIWKLVQSISAATGNDIDSDALRTRFDAHWPDCELSWAGFLEVRQVCNIQVVSIRRSRLMDDYDVAIVRRSLHRTIEKGSKLLVLDLKEVQSMSSSAIATFLFNLKTAESLGGKIVLANLCEAIRQSFSITRLDRIFGIYHSVDDALAALGRSDTSPDDDRDRPN